jgi:hypothetical protein
VKIGQNPSKAPNQNATLDGSYISMTCILSKAFWIFSSVENEISEEQYHHEADVGQ